LWIKESRIVALPKDHTQPKKDETCGPAFLTQSRNFSFIPVYSGTHRVSGDHKNAAAKNKEPHIRRKK
jgi:hypothetical protein